MTAAWRRGGQSSRRLLDVVYQDSMMRGPSRCPTQVSKRVLSTEATYLKPFTIEDMGPLPGNIPAKTLQPWRPKQHFNICHPEQLDSMRRPVLTIEDDVKLDETSDSHKQRHRFKGYVAICSAFDSGKIVKAMTLLEHASREWLQVRQGKLQHRESQYDFAPHIINDMISKLLHLRHKSEEAWAVVKHKIPKGDHWSPACLESSREELEDMSVLDLSFFALMDLYDMAGSLGIVPSTASTAKFLMSLSTILHEPVFTQCVFMVLLRLNGRSLGEARIIMTGTPSEAINELDFARIPLDLMRGLVNSYGNLKMPHIGELLFSQWASANSAVDSDGSPDDEYEKAIHTWRNASDAKRGPIGEPVRIDSTAWCSDVRLWAALVTSRARASDLAGARHWLQLYRDAGLHACKTANPKSCHEPYVAYLLACTRIRKKDVFEDDILERDARPDAWIAGGITRLNAIRDVINTMHEDGTGFPTRVGVMLVNILLGHGLEREASPLIKLLENKKLEGHLQPYRTKAILRQTKLTARKVCPLSQPDEEDKYWKEQEVNEKSARQAFQKLLATPASVWDTWSAKAKRDVLNNVFAASLATQDLPVVTRVLRLFIRQRIGPDKRTENLMRTLLTPDTLEQFEARQKLFHREQSSADGHSEDRGAVATQDDNTSSKVESSGTTYEHCSLIDPTKAPSAEFQRERLRTWIRFVDQAIVFAVRSTPNDVLQHFHFSKWVKHGRTILDMREDCSDDKLVKKLIKTFYGDSLDKRARRSRLALKRENSGVESEVQRENHCTSTRSQSARRGTILSARKSRRKTSESLLDCSLSMS